MGKYLILAVCGYLLGSFNTAIVVSRLTLGVDIRSYGSGNAGLTNSYRTMGPRKTGLVLCGDILKGLIAILLGGWLCGPIGKLIAGGFVILGHVFPVYFGFKGGKGVLVGATLLFLFDWRIFLIALAFFLASVLTTRWISLGSILGAASFPFSLYFFYKDINLSILGGVMSAAVIFLHRSNIGRILNGTESKFKFKVKPQVEKEDSK